MSVMRWVNFGLQLLALRKVKKRLLKTYLRTLNTIRKSIRGLFLLMILSQVFIVGLALTIYSGVQLLPADTEIRLYVLLGLGVTFMLASLAVVLIMTSDALWFRMSGAERYLKKDHA